MSNRIRGKHSADVKEKSSWEFKEVELRRKGRTPSLKKEMLLSLKTTRYESS